MNRIGLLPWSCLLGSALVLASGCASPLDEILSQDHWRTEEVAEVVSVSDLDDSVNRRCLETAVLTSTQPVAVMKIRIHRAPHRIAVAIPPSAAVKKKDKVRVNFDTCELQLIQ